MQYNCFDRCNPLQDGATLPMVAACTKQHEVFSLLVCCGADVNMQNKVRDSNIIIVDLRNISWNDRVPCTCICLLYDNHRMDGQR